MQVSNLLKLADLRYQRQVVLLEAQTEVVSACLANHDNCQRKLSELQRELRKLRTEQLKHDRLKAHELQINRQLDSDCQKVLDRHLEELSLHEKELTNEQIKLDQLLSALREMKLRTDALHDKLGTRITASQRYRRNRMAESAEDEFITREQVS